MLGMLPGCGRRSCDPVLQVGGPISGRKAREALVVGETCRTVHRGPSMLLERRLFNLVNIYFVNCD